MPPVVVNAKHMEAWTMCAVVAGSNQKWFFAAALSSGPLILLVKQDALAELSGKEHGSCWDS